MKKIIKINEEKELKKGKEFYDYVVDVISFFQVLGVDFGPLIETLKCMLAEADMLNFIAEDNGYKIEIEKSAFISGRDYAISGSYSLRDGGEIKFTWTIPGKKIFIFSKLDSDGYLAFTESNFTEASNTLPTLPAKMEEKKNEGDARSFILKNIKKLSESFSLTVHSTVIEKVYNNGGRNFTFCAKNIVADKSSITELKRNNGETTLTWITGSSHRIEISEGKCSCITLGNDKSEEFYPRVKETLGMPIEYNDGKLTHSLASAGWGELFQ